MAEEQVVAIPSPTVDLKRKLDEVEPEVHTEQLNGSDDVSNGVTLDDCKSPSDSSQAKRPKLHDEASDGLGNGKTQENGSSVEVKEEEQREEPKEDETEKPSAQKDESQDSEPLVEEVQDSTHSEEFENKTLGVDEPADEHVQPEDNEKTVNESPIPQENVVEECKDVNGGEPPKEIDEESKKEVDEESKKEVDEESKKEVDDESKELNDDSSQKEIGKENNEVDGEDSLKEVDGTQSITRRIDVPSARVGVLIGKGGETIRHLQFNSGAKIQILRDSEADPSSALRPVDIIGTVACIENAEKLISAVIAEAEAGGSPALVARGHSATHAVGIPEQIEIKVPNDKVGLIIGRGGETIKNMQTRSGARIQLLPQHGEGDGLKERTVRISGDKRQIDIATDMIKDVMYQNARPSTYSGGYNQPAYRPRGPGGPPQWGSRGPGGPHSMPYDYHHRGPYPSQGSHYNSPSYGGYPPQHMPQRSGYGASWDQRPPHSGPYDYYGRQGAPASGPLPPPSGHAPSPALGGPPPSQVSYGYGQSHGSEYGHAAPYSQTGHQQSYGQMYEQPKYDNNPPMQPPYGGSYPTAGGGQPGYSQPGIRPYGMQQGPVQQGYGPPRPAAAVSSGDVPYQGAAPAAAAAVPSYGNTNAAPQQQQYGYNSGAPVQQQAYPSYSTAPPSDGYNNGTQTPATGPTYQQQSVQPASSTHDQAAATGYGGQVAQPGGYSSYPSAQPAYGTAQTQNSGNYGYNTSSQDPNYGYGAAPGSQAAYSQVAPTQAGYEQQAATQPSGYAAAPGSAQGKTQSPQSAYAQYDASQVYAAPR